MTTTTTTADPQSNVSSEGGEKRLGRFLTSLRMAISSSQSLRKKGTLHGPDGDDDDPPESPRATVETPIKSRKKVGVKGQLTPSTSSSQETPSSPVHKYHDPYSRDREPTSRDRSHERTGDHERRRGSAHSRRDSSTSAPRSTRREGKNQARVFIDEAAAQSNSTTVRFSWRVARAFILLRIQPADSFSVGGVPFNTWPRTKIPTLGASPASCRVQEMYRVSLPGVGERGREVKLFVKVVPIQMWRQQWDAENQWNGEYATDGENFVMEAAALAFLHEYAPGVAPKLVGILEVNNSRFNENQNRGPATVRRKDDGVTHIVIVSELYGEDLLDYLDRRDRKDKPLNEEEKRALQIGCMLLMARLHSLGLAHLDFTPENILLGNEGLRLCDFAKATPLWSNRLRHVDPEKTDGQQQHTSYPFESCEPTVGKGAYMPPECWKIYWKLESQKILRPLEDLAPLRHANERMAYYFPVRSADIYMLGVVLFWIWSDGGVWSCSDPKQDEKFYHLAKSNMKFDLFRECRQWPMELKECVGKMLQPDPWKRASIDDVVEDPWCMGYEESADEDYLQIYCDFAMLKLLADHMETSAAEDSRRRRQRDQLSTSKRTNK